MRFVAEQKVTQSRGRWRSIAVIHDTHEDRVVGTFQRLGVAQDEAERLNRAHAEEVES